MYDFTANSDVCFRNYEFHRSFFVLKYPQTYLYPNATTLPVIPQNLVVLATSRRIWMIWAECHFKPVTSALV